jgi:mycothiol synthase
MLAYEHERLLGYAHTMTYGSGGDRRVSCEFVVHPEARRRGIGRTLLTQAVMDAQAQDARTMDIWANNDSPATEAIAAQFGFRPARRLLHLHRHVQAVDPVPAPAGVSVRAFRPGADDAAWLKLNNRIFANHPENGRWTEQDLRARMQQTWFNPADFLIAEVNGKLAGFCWLKVEDRGDTGRVGEIYVIGTAPESRGIGLGRFLLTEALRHLERRQTCLAAIYVDESNAIAVALYVAEGFHYHHVDVCYTRELRAEGATLAGEAA